MVNTSQATTQVGNYFVSNYPPFSQWKPEYVGEAIEALNQPARTQDPFGLYLHIPFCRKRCKFCYFKVYTDKNANEIEVYLDALVKEAEYYARQPAFERRELRFAYFGGGTPSYISEKQLHLLVEGLNHHVSWRNAEEVTFECEPGTLRRSKLETLKEIGVTRLSLGVEHFDDHILATNGRAHLSAEIFDVYETARKVDFPQINLDLIAGMVGETEDKWRDTVRKTLELQPDSVTIYQMELPYNTIISQEILKEGKESPIADWAHETAMVKFALTNFCRRLSHRKRIHAGHKKKPAASFTPDALWHGGDMIGLGVSSFSHFSGVHFQNVHSFEEYIGLIEKNQLPLLRALTLTPKQKLIREMILQMKTGCLDLSYFQDKFGVDVWDEFKKVFEQLNSDGLAERDEIRVVLTRKGLLQVDHFLSEFFEPELKAVRYV